MTQPAPVARCEVSVADSVPPRHDGFEMKHLIRGESPCRPYRFLRLCQLAIGFALIAIGGAPAARAESPTAKPVDVVEPPFGDHDFSWTNGTNRQPNSLLGLGPLTLSLYVDAYYAYQLSRPIDDTIFPTTVAPRHNEVGINLASFGFDVTGLDGPIGRVYVQYGSITESIAGQDTTTSRGFYLTNRAFNNIQQAAAGWHYHVLHGLNVEFGIFPSYLGLESYLPQENWNYTHAFLSDFTPYYFSGLRSQLFFTQDLKLEIWVVNGWQTFGQWQESKSGGYQLNWRPGGNLVLTNNVYTGKEVQGDPNAQRYYTDNSVQIKYYDGGGKARLKSASLAVVADYGFEHRGNSGSGAMMGYAVGNRLEINDKWALAARLDLFYDKTQAVITQLPVGNQDSPALRKVPFWAGGGTVTLDFTPSPWIIYRLEYAHRHANIPYFSGHGGVTGPQGALQGAGSTYQPDLAVSDDRLVANVTLRL